MHFTEDEVKLVEETDKQEDASLEDTEECMLEDCEDGISMEIGSENEDDLLEIDSEPSTNKMCNNEKTDTDILNESVDDPNEKSVASTNEETVDSNGSNAIEIDITSDNEEAVAIEHVKDFKGFKHASVERIQFEEDSNSNGNSGKINDIVNFLNHDLSGTNSPLTINDAVSSGDSKPNTIDNGISDTQNSNTENKGNMDVDMTSVIDVEQSEENNTNNKTNVEQIDAKTENKSENNEKVSADIKDKDAIIINESSNKELNSNGKNVEKDKKERKNSEGGTLNSKPQDLNSDKINGEEKENGIDEVDDDDDVIFEGATMPAMRNEYQKLSSNSNIKKDEVDKKDNSLKIEHNDDLANDKNDEDDDDVIFEKETKVEVPPKPNCDITNKLSSANNGNKSVLTIENSRQGAEKDSNIIENNSSEKVSVITSRNSSDRKRSAEDKDFAENESKRSKLDLTGLIGKLGSRVEPASIELSDDSDEEVDKPVVGDTEEKSAAVEKIEESKPEKNERLITVTEKVGHG